MSTEIRTARATDLADIARLIANRQRVPEQHIAYLGADVESITIDIESLDDWYRFSAVAEHAGELIGALVPELDGEMGRTWLFGPFVTIEPWDTIADGLYTHVRSLMPDTITEEEALSDSRNAHVRAWAERTGLIEEEGSVLLDLRPRARTEPLADRVRDLTAVDHEGVAKLHDDAFPGTHTTASALVASDHPRAVIDISGRLAGYVAYEVQSDNSGYIDYLAVDREHQGAGLGRALVSHACVDLFDRGVTNVHLSVREGNAAARALYGRIGFIEERTAVPFRKGFTLER